MTRAARVCMHEFLGDGAAVAALIGVQAARVTQSRTTKLKMRDKTVRARARGRGGDCNDAPIESRDQDDDDDMRWQAVASGDERSTVADDWHAPRAMRRARAKRINTAAWSAAAVASGRRASPARGLKATRSIVDRLHMSARAFLRRSCRRFRPAWRPPPSVSSRSKSNEDRQTRARLL